MQYDLGIIGAGPAGYVAAIRAGQAGLKTVLFDKHYIGGVCLNEGCIPTKTLLHTAKLYSHARSGSKYGLRINKVEVDMAALMKRKQKMVRKLVGGVKSQLKDSQVEVVMDQARISDSSLKKVTVEAGSQAYQCAHLLIATGSEPVYPPIPGLQQEQVYTSAEILQISELPEELTIIGGGVIGIEFADFFASMGTRVTVIEMLDEIIGVMDSEIAAMLRKELTRKGVDFKLGAQVTQMEGKTLTYRMQDKDYTHQAGQILLSVGRKPVLHIPGLEKLGLNYNNRGIETDAWYSKPRRRGGRQSHTGQEGPNALRCRAGRDLHQSRSSQRGPDGRRGPQAGDSGGCTPAPHGLCRPLSGRERRRKRGMQARDRQNLGQHPGCAHAGQFKLRNNCHCLNGH